MTSVCPQRSALEAVSRFSRPVVVPLLTAHGEKVAGGVFLVTAPVRRCPRVHGACDPGGRPLSRVADGILEEPPVRVRLQRAASRGV